MTAADHGRRAAGDNALVVTQVVLGERQGRDRAGAPAMELIASALASAAALFPNAQRPYALMRQAVIEQNPALRERERRKLADLTGEAAGALRARGITGPAATLAAESGASVFDVAFGQWIRERRRRSLAHIVASVRSELPALHALRGQPG